MFVFLFGGLGGVKLHLLLIFDEFADLLGEVFEFGFLGLRLFKLGDLVTELLLGLGEGFNGGLLGGRGLLLLGEGFFGFLHLLRGLGERLRGFGGLGRGLFLGVLGFLLHLGLLRGLLGELLGLGIRLGGFRLNFLLFLDQLLHLFAQFLEFGQLVLGFVFRGFGLGELVLQILLGVFELGDGLFLFLGRLIALLFAAALLVVKDGAGFLHFLGRGLEVFGGLRGDVFHVVTDVLGAVHDFGLALLDLGGVGGFALDFLGLGDDLLFLRDGFLNLVDGVAQDIFFVTGRHQHAGQFLEKIAGHFLTAGGAEEFGGLEVHRGGINGREQLAVARTLEGGAGAFAGRAVHVFREGFELAEDELGFVADGALLALLKLEGKAMRVAHVAVVADLEKVRQADDFLEVIALTAGERGETPGQRGEGLLALIFEEQLAKLNGDELLLGGSLDTALAGRIEIGRGAGELEQLHDLFHVLVAKPAQHGADGFEHIDVVAAQAVAFVFLDDDPELHGDALGGGLELLLLEFLLEETFGGELLNLGAGADQTDRQHDDQRTEQGQVFDFHEH